MKNLLAAMLTAVFLAGCAGPLGGLDTQRSTGEAIDDVTIGTKLKAALAADPELSALKINVDTDNGRVALRGTAPSEAARERATQLASNVKGVVSVDNQLSVAPAKG